MQSLERTNLRCIRRVATEDSWCQLNVQPTATNIQCMIHPVSDEHVPSTY